MNNGKVVEVAGEMFNKIKLYWDPTSKTNKVRAMVKQMIIQQHPFKPRAAMKT